MREAQQRVVRPRRPAVLDHDALQARRRRGGVGREDALRVERLRVRGVLGREGREQPPHHGARRVGAAGLRELDGRLEAGIAAALAGQSDRRTDGQDGDGSDQSG